MRTKYLYIIFLIFFSIFLLPIFNGNVSAGELFIMDSECKPEFQATVVSTISTEHKYIKIVFFPYNSVLNREKTEQAFSIALRDKPADTLNNKGHFSNDCEDNELLFEWDDNSDLFTTDVEYVIKIISGANGAATDDEVFMDEAWVRFIKMINDPEEPSETEGQLIKEWDGREDWSEGFINDLTKNITCIAIDDQDQPWIGTSEGKISYFDGRTWKEENLGISSNFEILDIPCIAFDKKENILWVGLDIPNSDPNTPKLAKYNLDENQWDKIITHRDINIEPEDKIKQIICDPNNDRIWFITPTSGIYRYYYNNLLERYSPYPDSSYPEDDFNLDPDIPLSFILDNDLNLYLGIPLEGIWGLDESNPQIWNKSYEFDEFDGLVVVPSMVFDPTSEYVWAGTNLGLYYFNGDSWSDLYADPNHFVNALSLDSINKKIYMGTENGLAHFNINPDDTSIDDDDRFLFYRRPEPEDTSYTYTFLYEENITALAVTSRGEVWFATEDGIQKRDIVSPYISGSIPENNGTLDLNSDPNIITIFFIEPINESTIIESDFKITRVAAGESLSNSDPNSNTVLSFALSADPNADESFEEEITWTHEFIDARTMIIKPDTPFEVDQSYTISIESTFAKDLANNQLDNQLDDKSEPIKIHFTTTLQSEGDIESLAGGGCFVGSLRESGRNRFQRLIPYLINIKK